MQNPVLHLRWSLLQKYLLTFNHELFLKKGSECVSEFSGVLGANSYIMHGGYLYCRFFYFVSGQYFRTFRIGMNGV